MQQMWTCRASTMKTWEKPTKKPRQTKPYAGSTGRADMDRNFCQSHMRFSDFMKVVKLTDCSVFTIFYIALVQRTVTAILMISYRYGKAEKRKEGATGRRIVREIWVYFTHVFCSKHDNIR